MIPTFVAISVQYKDHMIPTFVAISIFLKLFVQLPPTFVVTAIMEKLATVCKQRIKNLRASYSEATMYDRTVKTFDETTIIHMYKRQLMVL